MTKISHFLFFSGFALISRFNSGQTQPIGWASLNGGTTGGNGGDTILVSNSDELEKAVKQIGKRIVLITDTIWLPGERIDINDGDITVIGTENSMVHNGGFKIHADNVIIRNLSIGDSYVNGHWDGKGNPDGDALTLYGKNIWIDHCELFHSWDGLLDIGKDADFITVSWTKFSNHNKVMLIGSSDKDTISRGHLRTTIHHCWFDGYPSFYDSVSREVYRLNQRMPRVRFGDVHVFNNYYESNGSYCVAARFESRIFIENCFFRNVKDPHIIDDTGMGIRNPELGTSGNSYENCRGKRLENGTGFNPADYYSYSTDEVLAVPEIVMNGAGKIDRSENRFPVAVDDTVYISGNKSALKIDPLENDHDPDGHKIRISSVSEPHKNQVVIYPEYIEYTPVDYKKGSFDIIDYNIIDYHGGKANAKIYIGFK